MQRPNATSARNLPSEIWPKSLENDHMSRDHPRVCWTWGPSPDGKVTEAVLPTSATAWIGQLLVWTVGGRETAAGVCSQWTVRACPRAVVGICCTEVVRGAAVAHVVLCSSAFSWVESAVIGCVCCCSGEEDVDHNKEGSDLGSGGSNNPTVVDLLHIETTPAVSPALCSCPQSKRQAWSFTFYWSLSQAWLGGGCTHLCCKVASYSPLGRREAAVSHEALKMTGSALWAAVGGAGWKSSNKKLNFIIMRNVALLRLKNIVEESIDPEKMFQSEEMAV